MPSGEAETSSGIHLEDESEVSKTNFNSVRGPVASASSSFTCV